MKRPLTIFIQIVIVVLGIGVLALLLWEPQIEGRNVNATLFEIYFKDPFLAYAYVGSIAFFVALYQAFKAVGYVRQNQAFSQATAKALRTIKYCALIIIAFVLGAEGYIFIAIRGTDDIAGGVAMGLFIIIASTIIATTANKLEWILRNAKTIKPESNLAV